MKDVLDILMKVPEAITDVEKEQLKNFYENSGREKVYALAEKKKVIPFVAHSFSVLKVDAEFWQEKHDKYSRRNDIIFKKLDKLFGILITGGCKSPCVTENFAALLLAGNCMGCFCSGDVDISADISEKELIRKLMSVNGFKLSERREYRATLELDEYKCPEDWPENFFVNILWLPVMRERWWTIDQRLVEKWLQEQRSMGKSFKKTNIRILSPEASFIESLYHLSVGHYYCAFPGTRLLTEIDRYIRYVTLDWKLIQHFCTILNIEKRYYLALNLTRRVLDTTLNHCMFDEIEIKDIKRLNELLNKMYHMDSQGIYKLWKATSIVDRLYIDLCSDNGGLLQSSIKKTAYALRCLLTHNR